MTFQDGPFWVFTRMVGGKKGLLPKICDTYPTMMKLGRVTPYPRETQKKNIYIYKSRGTFLKF